MKYKPGDDQKEALDTKSDRKISESSGTQNKQSQSMQSESIETASYMQYECNMIIWGKW